MNPLPKPQLFTDFGCPYAHRVVALLDHLGVEYDNAEAPTHQRPEGLFRYSRSERIPLLVHGDLVIGESAVMLEYLAEAYAFSPAWPHTLFERTRQRHAMAAMDNFVTPFLFRDDTNVRRDRLEELLDVFEGVTGAAPAVPSLLSFHFAPVWVRLLYWRPDSIITSAFRARPALPAWLDEAASIDAVQRSSQSAKDMARQAREALAAASSAAE